MSAEIPGTSGSNDEMLHAIQRLHETMGSTGIGAAEIDDANKIAADERRFDLDAIFGDRAEFIHSQLVALERAIAVGRHELPQYLDEGSRSCVLHLPGVEPGQSLLAKMPRPDHKDPDTCYTRQLHAFTRGHGIRGAAQMVAHSHESRAVIVRYVEGDSLSDPHVRDRISPQGFRNLLQTYRDLQARDLVPDNYSPQNTRVTPDGGLVVVDYDSRPQHTLEEKVLSFGSECALLDSYNGNFLPAYARLYRNVCYEEFGKEIVNKLDAQWRSYGLFVPPLTETDR